MCADAADCGTLVEEFGNSPPKDSQKTSANKCLIDDRKCGGFQIIRANKGYEEFYSSITVNTVKKNY